MKFYEVMIASASTALNEPLTYSCEKELKPGQVVRAPLRNRVLDAVVVEQVLEPSFKSKPLDAVIDDVVLPSELLELASQVAKYYASPLSICYGQLLPKGVHIKRRDNNIEKATTSLTKLPTLTPDQKQALTLVGQEDNLKTITLRGETGSGKTRVYVELAKVAQAKGQGSIILVPEIGLTTQLVQEFEKVFEDVFVQHSKQTDSERHGQWLQILQHKAPIVVGPRSAIFVPINSLGLVVIDESHEQSYKQDQTPRYSTARVAKMRTNLQQARLVLGSATPSIEEYFVAQKHKYPIVRMSQITSKRALKVETNVVDMTSSENRGKPISKQLEASIAKSLDSGFQALIFHNRRGTSTSVLCESCGYLYLCPNCNLSLTHHHDESNLRCHVCGFSEKVSSSCPGCHKAELSFKGYGTKQLESQLQKLFPTAKVARFDGDNLKKESLSTRYTQLRDSQVDIIIGTQMIAKGLDLPKLETVGVPSVDGLLNLPDFNASQRFFQLVYQVMGRVGRHRDGKVILQTYNPKNPTLLHAINKDYVGFFDNELKARKMSNYPPFWFLLSLTIRRKSPPAAEKSAKTMAASIAKNYPSILVLGPSPAFHEKSSGGYKWQLVLKSKDRAKLVQIARGLPADWTFDLDPLSLLN